MPKPPLTVRQILDWAALFHARVGRWPRRADGPVGVADLTWGAVCLALKRGYRGLPGGVTLAELLRDQRGVRNKKSLPRLLSTQILGWADEYRLRTGDWPAHDSGPIPDTAGETWLAVDCALRDGWRGLPGGSSLARLLNARRGVRNHLALPPLTSARVLAWADAHKARTGDWPRGSSGPVRDAPGETWHAVDAALLLGHRGLRPGSSLARLLAAHRGVRHPQEVPRLSVGRVLVWADAHHARADLWPITDSGPISDALGETWAAVDAALVAGLRGFPGGDTLTRFLARHRGKRNPAALPPLTVGKIRGWMRAHRRRTGAWPGQTTGPIIEAPGESWSGVSKALDRGRRGLPGGMTLAKLARGFRKTSGQGRARR